MKLLLVADSTAKPEYEEQFQIIVDHLTQLGFDVETCITLNPIRLVLNKYKLIHFLIFSETLNIKNVIQNFVSTTFGQVLKIPTVISFYNLPANLPLNSFQLNMADAITAPDIKSLKKLKNFKNTKLIWPALPHQSLYTHPKAKPLTEHKPAFVINIESDFNLLTDNLKKLNLYSSFEGEIYVNALKLKNKFSASEIRKIWKKFTIENKLLNHLILILEEQTLQNIINQNKTFIDYTFNDLSTFDISEIINKNYVSCNLIVNENHATGLPQLWNNKRHFIQLNQDSFTTKKLFSTFIFDQLNNQNEHSVSTAQEIRKMYDLKFNELARLYTQIIEQKTIRLHHKEAKM